MPKLKCIVAWIHPGSNMKISFLTLHKDPRTAFDLPLNFYLCEIIPSMCRYSTRLFPVGQRYIIQASRHIKTEVGGFRQPMRKAAMHRLRVACHTLECSDD